ncbi:DUF4112 domain-containing protein [Falsiroseomonas sp.]|uniref:DUF4112 domain-containing protein n=1 Tax=Falsiroseomonas sp. TaxID=2870721 RepID=UPI00356820B4
MMSGRRASSAQPLANAHREEGARRRLEAIARVLDSKWRIPGTGIRFGADAALNLLPGLGLVASKGVSAYLILEARRLGVPTGTLLRMVGNVGVDALISAVPVAGWIGDIFFRANLRNMALLRRHLDRDRMPAG